MKQKILLYIKVKPGNAGLYYFKQHKFFFAFAGIAVKKIEAHCNAVVVYVGRAKQQGIPTTQPVL